MWDDIDWSIYQRLKASRVGRLVAPPVLSGERRARFLRMDTNVVVHDLRKGIPATDEVSTPWRAKGVPQSKLARIYNPASRPVLAAPRDEAGVEPATILTMGNIGHTQNLVAVTRAIEESDELRELGATFVLAGDGQAGGDVRAAIRTDRVRVTGVLDDDALEQELCRATVAVVSQSYEGIDFNVPSKLMNFMAYGLPTVASVRDGSEVARIVRGSGGGWVTDSSDTSQLAAKLAEVLRDGVARRKCGEAALRFAREHFASEHVAERFEVTLKQVLAGDPPRRVKFRGRR